MGSNIGTVTRADEHPAADLVDVQHDILTIAVKNPSVNWGWYQQGYGPESFDGQNIWEDAGPGNFTNAPQHASYIVHHNGPQYFGYVGDNPQEQAKLHGLSQFYTDVTNHALPAGGGVFYVRGGYYNNDNLKPADPNITVQHEFTGNDDHGSYSDSQISEALIADSVNAIANSPYWADSAIIITYDESDGFYDHQPEQFRTYGPDGQPETGGPRIPAIVISPYSAAHTISHVYSEHSSVVKFINELFNLTPLSSLPDEAAAVVAGAANSAFNKPNGSPQTNLGPADGLTTMGDLLEAFDDDRLAGENPAAAGQLRDDPAHRRAHAAALCRHRWQRQPDLRLPVPGDFADRLSGRPTCLEVPPTSRRWTSTRGRRSAPAARTTTPATTRRRAAPRAPAAPGATSLQPAMKTGGRGPVPVRPTTSRRTLYVYAIIPVWPALCVLCRAGFRRLDQGYGARRRCPALRRRRDT